MTIRESMLAVARRAIDSRAVHDGYLPLEYDGAADPEGYVISIINSLHHWCDEYGIDWQGELDRAQGLFEEDAREAKNKQPQR